MIKEISIKTSRRNELIDITQQVQDFVSASKLNEGICLIFVPHTTAAVTINENADPDVKKDLLQKLSQLIPEVDNYSHSEGNSDAHVKSSLVGCSIAVPFKESKLLLGTWQGILFCEFDGPRQRKAVLSLVQGLSR